MRSIIILAAFILIATSAVFAQQQKSVELKPVATKAQQRLFNAEDLMSMKRLSDPQLSPDGKKMLFSMGIPKINMNRIEHQIYIAASDGKTMNKLTGWGAAEYNARWSPDGKKIAFISTKHKGPQVWVMDYPAGEPKKLTDMPEGVSNMLWSPDGKYISFTSDVKMEKTINEKYPKYPKANLRVYEDLPIRHWSEWTDEKYSHLFIIPAEGGEPKDLMANQKWETPMKPFGGVEEIGWSPDSKQIAYTSKKEEEFENSTNSDVYIVDIANGKTTNLTKGMPGFDKMPKYSPDGRYIAFTSQARAGFESDKIRLMVFEKVTGKFIELTESLDQWTYDFIWAPDSKKIYFVAGDQATWQVYSATVPGSDIKKLTDGEYRYGSGMAMSLAGDKLIVGRQDFMHPVEFYSIPLNGGAPEQITKANFTSRLMLKSVKVEQRWIKSTDGADVHCWVLYPPDFDPKKKYPMITYCQGGPQSTITPRFHYRWNLYLFASQGYIVLAPNRRGLPGFGQDWNDAISLDWGGKPMQDILAATDALAKEPYVDNEGLCSIGASAGGYATFWLAGNHQGRFKAFASHCGVFNFVSMYGSTEELWFPNWEYGGPYWEAKNKAQYEKHSPHIYAQNWDTPIFISTGEHDYRVPFTQSLEAFTLAQVKGIPSKLLFFPKETHFIAHPQEFIVWCNELFDFLDKYTKGEKEK